MGDATVDSCMKELCFYYSSWKSICQNVGITLTTILANAVQSFILWRSCKSSFVLLRSLNMICFCDIKYRICKNWLILYGWLMEHRERQGGVFTMTLKRFTVSNNIHVSDLSFEALNEVLLSLFYAWRWVVVHFCNFISECVLVVF